MMRKIEKIKNILEKYHWENIESLISDLHPQEIYLLIRDIPDDKKTKILIRLKDSILVKLLPKLSAKSISYLLNHISSKRASELLKSVPIDERVDILMRISPLTRARILNTFDEETRKETEKLMKYHPETAGGIMTTQYIALKKGMKVKDALRYIRKEGKNFSVLYLYVVDSDNKLLGVLSLRQLLITNPNERIEKIMEKNVKKVHPNTKQDLVAKYIKDYDLLAIPVVDENDRIVGIVTVDDAMEVMEKEVNKNFAKKAGIKSTENFIEVSAKKLILARLTWLILGVLVGTIAARVVGIFEDYLEAYIALAAFMPVLVYISDTAATQTQAIVIRAIALDPNLKISRILKREAIVALALSFTCSSLLFIISFLGWGSVKLSIIVGFSLFLAMFFMILLTTSLPFMIRKLGIDPAVACDPLATAISDISTLIIYFLCTSIFFKIL